MTSSKLTKLLLVTAMLGVPACKTTTPQDEVTLQPSDGEFGGPIVGSNVPSEVLGGWFVRKFDVKALEQIRNRAFIKGQDLHFTLIPPKGSGITRDREIRSNAFRDIGIDYARSVGLTGKGVTISVVDSPVNVKHADFARRRTIAADAPAVLGEMWHGTAVAGIAVGRNGVAPGARLHHADISFEHGMKLSTLAGIMRDAAAKGALVSNNSWALTATVRANRGGSFLAEFAAGRDYLQSLREFTQKGIVVFAATNDYSDDSAHLMAGLPALYPKLEQGWLTVINAIPKRKGNRVTSAIRVSAGCLEAARWCIAANGQANAPSPMDLKSYQMVKGASYAAPQISGAIALLAEAFPDLTAAQLRARLLVTADNGFFRHDGVVRFAPGLRHGYSKTWGHGFADLRAALLPIGAVTTKTRAGRAVNLQDAVVLSGTAMGDGLSRNLARQRMVVNDQMSGAFTVSAASIIKERLIAPPELVAAMMKTPDLRDFRRNLRRAGPQRLATTLEQPATLTQTGSYSIDDGYDIALVRKPGYRLSAIRSPGSSSTLGLAASRIFSGPSASIELGVEAIRESGSIMGTQASVAGTGSRHIALTAQAAIALQNGSVLRFGGKLGRASGGRVGQMISLGDQRFNSLDIALSLPDVATRGDVLTLFSNRPVAVSSGSANIGLARPTAAGDVSFGTVSADSTPSARQMDIGLEYLRPIGKTSDLVLALRHIHNAGNMAGRRDTDIGIRFDHRF